MSKRLYIELPYDPPEEIKVGSKIQVDGISYSIRWMSRNRRRIRVWKLTPTDSHA